MRDFPERSTKNSVHPSRLGKMAFLMMLTSQSRMSSALRAASIRAFSSSLYSPLSLESTSSFKFPAKKTSSPLSCNRQLTFSSQSRISVCAASTTTRAASSSAEVDDEQLDAVLDSILEEVIYEAGGPASKNPPSPAKSKALPKALIEVRCLESSFMFRAVFAPTEDMASVHGWHKFYLMPSNGSDGFA